MSSTGEEFEHLHQKDGDPWGFRTRWYERRKRDVLLASLPHERYRSAWEVGCSNGELAAALAPRCESLLAIDGSGRAVELAGERLREFPGARAECRRVPAEWPSESFDLIVLSEVGYFLKRAELAQLIERLPGTLGSDGVLVACHWQGDVIGYEMNGDEVQRTLVSELPWTPILEHREADFALHAWSVDGRSVAEREGLR